MRSRTVCEDSHVVMPREGNKHHFMACFVVVLNLCVEGCSRHPMIELGDHGSAHRDFSYLAIGQRIDFRKTWNRGTAYRQDVNLNTWQGFAKAGSIAFFRTGAEGDCLFRIAYRDRQRLRSSIRHENFGVRQQWFESGD